MKCWVIKRAESTGGLDFEFEKVESKTMEDAVLEVEKGLAVVSPYFKRNYPKYSSMWDKLNKHYRQLQEEEIDSLLANFRYVDGHQIYFDAVMYNKNSIDFDFRDLDIAIYSISDYNFEQVLLYMKAIVDTL